MKTRKGPYGHFAIEKIKNTESLYKYAMQIIENGQVEGLLDTFSEEKRNCIELSFDYSGLTSIEEYKTKNNDDDIYNRRNAIKDLFILFKLLLNRLMPLDNLVLDTRFIFYDAASNKINLCYIPIKSEKELVLSSINTNKFEEILQTDFFTSCLSSDEITTIIYAIKNNDETLLEEVLTLTPNTQTKKTFNIDRLSYQLLLILDAICAIMLFYMNRTEYALFLSAMALGLFIKVTYDNKKSCSIDRKEPLKSKRSEILFTDKQEKSYEANELFSYASLETVQTVNGEKETIGLYSNETTIGSDRFIADIYIEDPQISELQAKIIHDDNSYWIIDLSKRNNTYLENRSIKPNTKYEIKNGQVIRMGSKDYIFKIGY
ncbi:MAG: FHA domain-containing protein [Clostridia bacterium]|nr:FHA domain-containing protein [Clostridia bacterium]